MKKERIINIASIISMLLAVVFILACIPYINSAGPDKVESSATKYMEKIFNKDSVQEINIEIPEGEWADLLQNAADEVYHAADITINGEMISSVGVRAKGNSSLSMVARDSTTDRYSFKIKFSEYINDQSYYGLDKLSLNNIMSDSTYMKEYLSYDMFEFMDIPTPGFSYVNITINGEPWGLYLAVENLEEEFIERNYGDASGNLYKPEGNAIGGGGGENNQIPGSRAEGGFGGGGGSTGTNLVYKDDNISSYSGIFDNSEFKTTTEADYKTVIAMMKNLNSGTNLEEYLDIDEILRYFSVNTFLVNLDSYAGSMKHNYYLYEEDGIFQILPWDYNLAFAGHQVNDGSKAINFPIDAPVSDTPGNSPLIEKLLEVDEYKELYHDYLEELVVNYIESGRYEANISKVNELIKSYVKDDATAFTTYAEFQQSLLELLKFGDDRADSIMAQLSGQQPSTSYGTLTTDLDLSALGSMMGGGDRNMGGRGGQQAFKETRAPDEIFDNINTHNITPSDFPVEGRRPQRPEGMVGTINQNENNDNIQVLIVTVGSIIALLTTYLLIRRVRRRKFTK